MKRLVLIFLFLALVLTLSSRQTAFPEITGPYLGQKPPGQKAELFAHALLSAGYMESHSVFSPDGTEFIYSVLTPAGRSLVEPRGVFGKSFLMYSRLKDGQWTEPNEFLYNCGYTFRYPFFTPDGNRIIINPTGLDASSFKKPSSGLWYLDRQSDGWSEPKEIEFGKNYMGPGAVYPSIAANGNLYFALFPDGVNGFIYMSKYEKGAYSLPEKLSDSINDDGGNHPYIAPDESYIIFDSERTGDTLGKSDLYISFCDLNGKWMSPENLGEGVNSVHDERRPFVTFDSKYLFFVSDRVNPEQPDGPITITKLQQLANAPENSHRHIYWVSAKFIEDLRPQ